MQTPSNIKALTTDHSNQALQLVANEFSAGSPLHRAMGITQQEYLEYLSDGWNNYAFGGPVKSLGAFCKSSQQLIGCLIASHFPVSFDNLDTLPQKHKPIAALLQELENEYLKHNYCIDRSLLVDLAVVRHDHRGSGIYQQLRAALHNNAASSGYKTVFGELSSSSTQYVCANKSAHQVVAEINYKDFNYGGRAPFATIEDPHSIQLVSVSL